MGFNEEQARAIQAGIDKDILITAGAGSGKTKTLSERVYRIISDPDIGLKPSELLVLTFTNNAAYEMKTRIVARFAAEGPEKAELASQMVSAHIQTFDSFNQYLVTTYSDRLGLPNSIKVADATVMAVKEKDALEEVMDEFYQDEASRRTLAKLIRRFSWKVDDPLKEQIMRTWKKIRMLTPDKQRDFFEHYEERFLSRDFIDWVYEGFMNQKKSELKKILYSARLAQEVGLEGDGFELLSSDRFWKKDIHALGFSDDVYAVPAYQAILDLIDTESVDFFFEKVRYFKENYGPLFPSKTSRPGQKDEKERLDLPFKVMKDAYGRQDSVINVLNNFLTPEEAKEELEKERDIYVLFIEIIKKLDEKMKAIRRGMNAFDFSDISAFALELLTLPEYEDIAEEVRTRFRYIMVDEYQDTNDAQEVFLGSLLKPSKKGERAHLFCVGDAKQSIYAFRNSNVELFRKRQNAYLDGDGHEVIAMNKNYRSGPGLLHDLNYIFRYYMTLDHGGIDYSSELERLKYDEKVNLYSKRYPNMGVQRIVPPFPLSPLINQKEFEAQAIIHDIQEKVNSGYLVYDRGCKDGLRPCRYSDFVILMRNKKGFLTYQKLFNRAGIKLNNTVGDDLREVSAVILLQSLLGMVAYFLGESKVDIAHVFVSYLRSYVSETSDEEIARLFAKKDLSPEERFAGHPAWEKAKAFAFAHKHSPFRSLFLDLLVEFGLFDQIHKLGEVRDLTAKIESMYVTAESADSIGANVHDFYEMLQSISRHHLALDSETVIQSDDAVDMMTIHASKGLEQKIVYMPCSFCGIGGGKEGKNRALFSEKYGIQFPRDFDLQESFKQEDDVSATVLNVADLRAQEEQGEKADIDEHVRIFYVALTRAENTVIIVGDPFFKKNGSPYEMLSCCPHRELVDFDFLNSKVEEGAISKEDLRCYKETLSLREGEIPLLPQEDIEKEAYAVYIDLYKQAEKTPSLENEAVTEELLFKIFESYFLKVKALSGSADEAARLFIALDYPAFSFAKTDAESFYAFLCKRALEEKPDEEDEEDGEGDSAAEEETETEFAASKSGQSFHRAFNLTNFDTFKTSLCEALMDLTEIERTKKGGLTVKTRQRFAYEFATFVEFFDHRKLSYTKVYKTPEFDDVHYEFEFQRAACVSSDVADEGFVCEVSDETIEFPERVKERASKMELHEDETAVREILDRGVFLHRLMELTDLKTRDISFIQDEKDRALIQRVLDLPIMKDAQDADVYPEYGYFDPELGSMGFIDLLYKKGEKLVIVDYKFSNIDDPAYDRQLHTYARNVARIFGVKEEEISLHLLSIARACTRKVG